MTRVIALLAAALAIELLTGCTVSAKPSCAVLASPPPLTGRFDEFDLDDPCSSRGFNLTTNATDDAPLFTTMISDTGCTWSVATISAGRIVIAARVEENVYATKPVTSDEKTYWFPLDGRYYRVGANGATSSPAFTPGYSVTTIGAMRSGQLFSIEKEKANESDSHLRLLDMKTGKSRALPANGWAEDLTRAWDGNLYFRLFSNWRCSIYEVTAGLNVIMKAMCPWENGDGIALSTDGGVWQPFIGGVGHYTRSTIDHRIGVFSKYTCTITNTAALEARNIVSDSKGNVWFQYASRLWRRDPTGQLFSVTLPPNVGGAMVETRDGTVWITGNNRSGLPALFHFTPSPPG